MAFTGLTLVSLVLGLLVPLRPQGADTVPGRLAMATLACEGRSDLSTIDWLVMRAQSGRLPYYARVSDDERSIVSAFGPGPGWLGWPFFEDVRPGSVIADQQLRERARIAASTACAVATLLLALGLLAVSRWGWALAGAATASLSFAGIASLSQGLWQQTAALPCVALGVALALWCRRRPVLLPIAVSVAVVGAWLRPPDAALALGVALLAVVQVPLRRLSRAMVACTLLGSMGCSVALGAWNLWYYGTFLPVAQWQANQAMAQHVLQLDLSHVATGLYGLVASPGRGLLWFAPVLPLASCLAVRARRPYRKRARVLLAAVAIQLLLCAAFHKWWGGVAFGPRLLALAVWLAGPLALLNGAPRVGWQRILLGAAMIQTVAIGLLGAWLYDPRKWEIPNDVDRQPETLLRFRDSHWVRLFHPVPPIGRVIDAPEGPFRYCDPHGLRQVSTMDQGFQRFPRHGALSEKP